MNGRVLDPNRPKTTDLRPLIAAVYAKRGGEAGCCLHVVTDDGNYDNAEFVLHWANEKEAEEPGQHVDCVKAAELMVQMTQTQIAKACRRQ